MPFSVPDLPYAYDALEPHIDEATMRVHHDKHHQAYVDKANAALEGTEWADKRRRGRAARTSTACPPTSRARSATTPAATTTTRSSGRCSAPTAAASPSGDLGAAIDAKFGSFDAFKDEFKNAGIGQFGSGWAWLVHDGSGLAVAKTPNQDSPISDGQTAAARLRRLGARLLPQVPEQTPGLPRRLLERRQLGLRRPALRRRQLGRAASERRESPAAPPREVARLLSRLSAGSGSSRARPWR